MVTKRKPIIRVEHLNKTFRQRKGREGLKGAIRDLFDRQYRIVQAVHDISFSIDPGEIVGYIGPNGAGKSTTMKVLSGILVPSDGIVEVNGLIPYKQRQQNAKKIGVVFGQRTQLWWDIPVSETLSLMRYIYDVPESRYKENIAIFRRILGLDEFINAPVRQLSLGQRMRADICAALLHDPEIVYLDEATIGLDVVVKERIREFVSEINRNKGTTILLATHDMSDVERLSSRIIVINNGQLAYEGSLPQLRKLYGSEDMITADIIGDVSDINDLYAMGVTSVSYENHKISVKYNTQKVNSSVVIEWLVKNNTTNDINIIGMQIEDIIRNMYNTSAKS